MIRVTLQAALVAVVVAPSLAVSQSASTASAMLARGLAAYERFNVEVAVLVLDSALATKQLTPQELVTAYKYAGAGNAVLGRTNASIRFYREAIKRDTAITLDPARFAKVEIDQFQLARLSLLQGKPDSDFPFSAPTASASRTPAFAEIRLGTGMVSGADFYVDGQPQGYIKTLASWKIPADVPVRLSIRSANCTTPWDTTVVAPANTWLNIGRRNPTGCSP